MDNIAEDIVDPEEYLFWIRIGSQINTADTRDQNKILSTQQQNDAVIEWQQEYELIYKSHKLENY